MRRRTVTLGAAATAMSAATFMTLPSAAVAGKLAVWGESLDYSLNRVLERRDLAVVIATHPVPDVFEVNEVLYGEVAVGERLRFENCEQLLMLGSTEDLLRLLVERAPVLDPPTSDLRTVHLPGDRSLESYAPPGPKARFLVFLEYQVGADWWGFATQTFGDFYLLGEQVFRKSFVKGRNNDGSVWVRVHPELTSEAFLDLVKARLAAERGE